MTSMAAPPVLSRPERIGPRRPERLQIALSVEERRRLAENAQRAGYESVAAFIWARTLLDGPYSTA